VNRTSEDRTICPPPLWQRSDTSLCYELFSPLTAHLVYNKIHTDAHHSNGQLQVNLRQPGASLILNHQIFLSWASSYSSIHFWHAPLWAHSAKRRHHSPEWRFWATSIASLRERFNDSSSCWVVFIPVVSSSSSRGKLLRSAWHLIRLTFVQCGCTERDAVLEQ